MYKLKNKMCQMKAELSVKTWIWIPLVSEMSVAFSFWSSVSLDFTLALSHTVYSAYVDWVHKKLMLMKNEEMPHIKTADARI